MGNLSSKNVRGLVGLALANMLCVDINVLCTIGQAEQLITCNSSATGVVNIGLIGKLHYVALERQQSHVSTEDRSHSPDQGSTL